MKTLFTEDLQDNVKEYAKEVAKLDTKFSREDLYKMIFKKFDFIEDSQVNPEFQYSRYHKEVFDTFFEALKEYSISDDIQ